MPPCSNRHDRMNGSSYWRKRAERLRGYAAEMTDQESKRALVELAHRYERLAHQADEQAEEDEMPGR
jgi:hypothetical protein